MSFEMQNQIAMALSVFCLVVLVSAFVYGRAVVIPRRKAQRAKVVAWKAFKTEVTRIACFPKLASRYMMRVPKNLMDKNPICRSYGTRYNRMLVIDDAGQGWVGLVIPEILESLTAGEYIWHDYHIPFRGAGEAYTGNAVTIEDLRIDIYPVWMKEGVNVPDWNLWAQIERNFRDCSLNWNYQTGLGELNQHMEEFREKRANFNRLVASAKMEVK